MVWDSSEAARFLTKAMTPIWGKKVTVASPGLRSHFSGFRQERSKAAWEDVLPPLTRTRYSRVHAQRGEAPARPWPCLAVPPAPLSAWGRGSQM